MTHVSRSPRRPKVVLVGRSYESLQLLGVAVVLFGVLVAVGMPLGRAPSCHNHWRMLEECWKALCQCWLWTKTLKSLQCFCLTLAILSKFVANMSQWIIEFEMFELEKPANTFLRRWFARRSLECGGPNVAGFWFLTVQKVMAEAQSTAAPALLSQCPCFPIKQGQ